MSTPTAPSRTELTPTEIRDDVLSALAEVRAVAVPELLEEMGGISGQMEIDSREAEAVIAILETRYGRELAKVEDLEPEVLPSLASLSDLIHRRWHDADGSHSDAGGQ